MAAPRAERRLAAILAADVVGYSRLMERDEAGTLERLKVHRKEFVEPLIAEHRGRVVKLMGDGALCEFASVVDAVACAVAIQQGMSGRERGVPEAECIRFRIGINLGDVIVEGQDIYGDGVNVAARLEGLAEPGGICVSGKVREELRKRLDLAFAPMGQQRVKNLAEPVEAWRVVLSGGGVPLARKVLRAPGRARAVVAAALALLLLAAAGVGGWWWQAGETGGPPLPDEPSIAVLPFDNPSGDERLGRLADGMVENVIAELPRFGAFVIAPGTSFSYRNKTHDARSIGRELGVRFVVEGSLQGDGRRLRATVSLVDATTGGQVWSERYDRPLDDLFTVQDELAQQIVNSVGGPYGATRHTLTKAANRKPTENLEAYDLFLLALQEKSQGTEEAYTKALELTQQAIELDPYFGRAYSARAAIYQEQTFDGYARYEDVAAKWREAATRAVTLDPDNGWARVTLANSYAMDHDFARYATELGRAAELAGSDASLLVEVASQLPWAGQTGRALELLERGLRLDPGSIDNHRWAQRIVYFHARRFTDAAAATEATDTDYTAGMAWNIMIYAQLGRTAELERWRSRLLEQLPDWSVELYFNRNGEYGPAATAERALVLESIAKAGLPRCATPEQLAANSGMRRMPECEANRGKAEASKT